MSKRLSRKAASLAVALALLWAVCASTRHANAQSTNTPWRHLTMAQLSAVWWQWTFSLQVANSPQFDPTGVNAYNSQPYIDTGLLFLTGTITSGLPSGDVAGQATRTISVKQGVSLFFPLLNNEWDNTCGSTHLGGPCGPGKFPNMLGFPQLQGIATALTDTVQTLYSTVTPADASFNETGPATNLGYSRLIAPPFSFKLPATGNIYQYFQVPVSGTIAPAAADGYFTFVPGVISPGNYILKFGGLGLLPGGTNTFTEDLTYKITVTP
jgi:hypothetical protein